MFLFSLPIVMGEVLQNLYSSVDSLVVGNFVGRNALAAVSVSETLVNLLVGFFTGMSMGSSVIVSRAFGSRDEELLERSMRVSFTYSVALGVCLSIVGIFVTPWLVRLSAAPEEVYKEAVLYLRIYLAGILFTVIYNISAGILRAVGDSRTPFVILMVSCVTNILLDLVFVVYFSLGVAGVGFATILSQALSVCLAYRQIHKRSPAFRPDFAEAAGNRAIVAEVTRIGMPSGLQTSFISFSNIFVWRYINGFSATAMAGIGIAQRLDKFINMPSKAFGLTITTFVSQNTGAGDQVRARKGEKHCLFLSYLVTGTLGILVYTFAEPSVAMFSSDPEVIRYGVDMMHSLIPFYTFMVLRDVYQGILRGYGNTKVPMALSLIGMIVVRQIFLAVSMHFNHSIVNIYIGYPLAWVVTAVLTFLYYQRVKGRLYGKQLTAEESIS